MNNFTDDDLNDWKDRLRPEGGRAVVGLPIEKQRALLARLEAAERYVKATWGVIEIGPGLIRDEIIESHEAWCKLKGE